MNSHTLHVILVTLACALMAPASLRAETKGPAKSESAKDAPRREMKRRVLRITDDRADTIPELHVSADSSTTLSFSVPLRPNGILLSDRHDVFFPLRVMDRVLVVAPKKDLSARDIAALTVSLADGTLLSFKLVTAPKDVDLQVDVELALEKKAPPASAQAMKGTINDLEAKLDDCQAAQGTAGLAKVATLIAAQDLAKPDSYFVERRQIHKLDKQSRLLVEARQVYWLFGTAYLVATLQNRDPSKDWVLDRPEIKLTGGNAPADVKVLTFAADSTGLAPDQIGKVVIAFNPPSHTAEQHFTLSLFQKNGDRHVVLEDLSL